MSLMTNLLVDMSETTYQVLTIFRIITVLLLFLASIVAIVVVLLQQSNSDGIQGITGSSETFFGKNKGQSLESKLKKWTWISLGIITGLSLIVFILEILLA